MENWPIFVSGGDFQDRASLPLIAESYPLRYSDLFHSAGALQPVTRMGAVVAKEDSASQRYGQVQLPRHLSS